MVQASKTLILQNIDPFRFKKTPQSLDEVNFVRVLLLQKYSRIHLDEELICFDFIFKTKIFFMHFAIFSYKYYEYFIMKTSEWQYF